jgi:transposase-like protein
MTRIPPLEHLWHLDEMAVLICGKQFWPWPAVDDEGEVLDLLVQRRRDKAAADAAVNWPTDRGLRRDNPVLTCARRWRRSWCNCGTSTKRLLGSIAPSQRLPSEIKRRAG